MQKKPPSSFCAAAAIVAALALGSTPALAQDGAQDAEASLPTVAPPAPVTAAPVAAPAPAAAAPTMTMTQSPVVQAIPPASTEPAPAQSRAAQPRAVARPAPAQATTPAIVAAVPLAATSQGPVAQPVAAPAIGPVEPVAAAAPALPPADDGLTGTEAGFLALLAAAGLAGAGLLAMRSRRRARHADEHVDEVVETIPVEAVPVAVAVPAAAPVADRPAASPERFAMPAGPVPTGAERDALLQRMIAAPPDAANPFVSRKRRAQRARILLAQREATLRSRSTEPFDWRTYCATGANVAERADSPPKVAHNPT